MRYLAVEFACTLESPAQFPPYQGSMLRGALGNSLRRATCLTRIKGGRGCPDCLLRTTCPFPRLFTFALVPRGSKSAPMAPPPFCLEPHPAARCEYAAGEMFFFTLKLFAYAVDYLPYFIHAFTLAGQAGLGRGTMEGQGRFTLVDVRQAGVSIYDAAQERLLPHANEELALPVLLDAQEASAVRLDLLTPLRFKQANHLAAALDFSTFVLLVLRRLHNLHTLERREFRLPSEDFLTLRQRAADMCIAASNVYWKDWRRYSGRQNTAMQLGGLLGNVYYRGPAAAFAEYLDFAAKAHLGKQTSFGLGRINVARLDAC